MKRERVTEIVVKTVALAVEQDTVGSAVTKVSLNSEFISQKNDEKNCS